MPVWLAWIRFINPIFYAVQSAETNEFEGRNFEGINFYELTKENLDIWHCMVYLVAMGLFLRILVFFGLYLAVNKKI